MMMTLCATCHRAIFSWETPSAIEGLPPDIGWTHYVAAKYGDFGEHKAVPCRFFLPLA